MGPTSNALSALTVSAVSIQNGNRIVPRTLFSPTWKHVALMLIVVLGFVLKGVAAVLTFASTVAHSQGA